MKEKKLLRALGNVDNQYIKEAEPMKKTSKVLGGAIDLAFAILR
jgi:hypothetical protein